MALPLVVAAAAFFAASASKAQTVKFPDPKSASLKEGTFIPVENLKLAGVGMTKDQMYALLGTPHFNEGVFSVTTWNYIFKFRQQAGVLDCQFQVEYTSTNPKLVSATYWNSSECADMLKAKAIEPAAAPAPTSAQVQHAPARRFTLSSDALFGFGRADVSGISGRGTSELNRVAEIVKQEGSAASRILITGHTDRIGSQAANLRLSEQRARSVRDYLVQRGVDARNVQVLGAGASEPVANCPGRKSPAVIACLAPNRRVTLDVRNAA